MYILQYHSKYLRNYNYNNVKVARLDILDAIVNIGAIAIIAMPVISLPEGASVKVVGLVQLVISVSVVIEIIQ